MNTNYVVILDYSVGEVIKIKLNEEQIKESEKYDDFESYLETLEDKYDFRLKDCLWMVCDTLITRKFGFLLWPIILIHR